MQRYVNIYVNPMITRYSDILNQSLKLAAWLSSNRVHVNMHYFDGKVKEWFALGKPLPLHLGKGPTLVYGARGIMCSEQEMVTLFETRGDILAFGEDELFTSTGRKDAHDLIALVEKLLNY